MKNDSSAILRSGAGQWQRIVNANHSIVGTAAVHRVAYCMIWRVIPQPTERQHIGNQIDAAMIFARAHFIVTRVCHSAPRASCHLGREQSCVWWLHQPESRHRASSGRSDPLRGASRYPQAECKAPPHCMRRGPGNVMPFPNMKSKVASENSIPSLTLTCRRYSIGQRRCKSS